MKNILNEGKCLIRLIASVINDEDFTMNHDNIDLNVLYKLSKFHGVESLLYAGLKKANIELSVELKNSIVKNNQMNIYKEATQEVEKSIIFEKLEANKIKYLPLKGSVMKYLYPLPQMRSMVDLDILIEPSKLKSLRTIMKSIGYKAEHIGGNHDVYFKKPFMNVELHRAMMDEVYAMGKYYRNIWDKAKKTDEATYHHHLRDEDFYIFMIVHTAKHYSQGGTGIRSVLDVWVFLKQKQGSLNWDYINREFYSLGILLFANNFKQLSNIWFGNSESSELFELMNEYIINSGATGISGNSNIVNGFMGEDAFENLNASKSKYLLSRIFPPYRLMCKQKKILKKLPFLLPWFWLTRLLKGLFYKRKTALAEMQYINNLKEENIRKIIDVHEKTGI